MTNEWYSKLPNQEIWKALKWKFYKIWRYEIFYVYFIIIIIIIIIIILGKVQFLCIKISLEQLRS